MSLVGVGGMGEVYRARDSKLGRDVALKVLAASVAGDPDRLARFRREAQVLAALNHPNIAAIYGFEDSGPTHALVMELVDGQTLDQLLRTTSPQASGQRPQASGAAEPGVRPEEQDIGHWQRASSRCLLPRALRLIKCSRSRARSPRRSSSRTNAASSIAI